MGLTNLPGNLPGGVFSSGLPCVRSVRVCQMQGTHLQHVLAAAPASKMEFHAWGAGRVHLVVVVVVPVGPRGWGGVEGV